MTRMFSAATAGWFIAPYSHLFLIPKDRENEKK